VREGGGNIPISVIIVLLKYLRHALEADTALHKQVERDGLLPFSPYPLASRQSRSSRPHLVGQQFEARIPDLFGRMT